MTLRDLEGKFAPWFVDILKKVYETGYYEDEELVENNGSYTPVDLIARECLNNGGGSYMGFFGISEDECVSAFGYIVEHQDELAELHLYSKDGYNNFGCQLWSDYKIPAR